MSSTQQNVQINQGALSSTGWTLLFWWLPLLLVGAVVVTVLLSAPWLIWTFCWVLLIGAFWGRPHRHRSRY